MWPTRVWHRAATDYRHSNGRRWLYGSCICKPIQSTTPGCSMVCCTTSMERANVLGWRRTCTATLSPTTATSTTSFSVHWWPHDGAVPRGEETLMSTKFLLPLLMLLLSGCANVSVTTWATYTPPQPVAAGFVNPLLFIHPAFLPRVIFTPRGPIVIFGDCL